MRGIKQIRFCILILCFSVSVCLSGQEGIAYHFYPELSHQNIINPKVDSSLRLSVSAFGYTHLLSNSVSIGDVSVLEGNVRTIDLDLSKDKIKEQNMQEFSAELNVLHLEYYLNNIILKGGYNQKNYLQLSYPKAFYSVMADGNAQFIGQNISLDPHAEITSLHEFYGGFSIQFSKLSLGANLKYLSGISNLHTENNRLELETSDDVYQLQLNTNIELQTSGVLTYNSIDDVLLEFNRAGFSGLFIGNYGYGLDLGVDYNFSKDSRIFASLQNLGSIKWDLRGTSYTSTGEKSYDGIDVIDYIGIDDTASFRDSIESLLEVVESDLDYNVNTPPNLIVGIQYYLGNGIDVGALINSRTIAGDRDNAIGLNIRKEITPWLSIGSSYTNRFNTYENLGISVLLTSRNFKALLSTENMLSVYDPINKRNFSVGGGLSLMF